jgi:hypothetical protein
VADVSNSFEGGTAGTGITTGNSGGASGTAFQAVSVVSGGAATFTATAYRGSLAGSFASGVTAGITYAEYNTSVGAASTGSVYGRLRFRLPTLPPDATGVRVAVITDSTGSFRAELRVIDTGLVSLRGPAGTALATFTGAYVAGTWWDVALSVLVFSATVGQIEAKRYDAFGVVAQTLTSAANQNTLGAGGANKLQAGMIRSVANYTVLLDDVAWSTTAYPSLTVAQSVVYGPWSGGVTAGSVTAGYVLAGTASARLVVSTSSALTSPVFSSAVAPDSDGMVKLTASGLTAGTQYFYGVEADGIVLTTGRGEVKTFPTAGSPANFAVAFGSCQFTIPSDSTFAAILARTGAAGGRALQIIHMGDMHYQDWGVGTTAAQVFTQHMTSLGSSSMAPALAKIPLNYIWDNHDWGGDTSDKTAAAGDVVAAAWRKVYPAYSLPATDGRGGYHSWVIGRLRFIQLDVRSYRDPQAATDGPTKTMLGSEQKAWLKARLSDPEPVKILCGNYPWRDDGVGSGRWGSYLNEWTELSDYIDTHVPGKVYVLFGDRHFLAADDGTGASTRGIPQAGGAPFQQASVAVTDTWSQGSYTLAPSQLQAYGWLDVTDDGDLITLSYAGVTSLDGTTRVSMTTVFDTNVAGVGASTLPPAVAAGTGTARSSGASALTLPPVAAAGAGLARTTGTAASTLPPVVAAGAGTVTDPTVVPADRRTALLARAQAAAVRGMVDVCTIRRPSGISSDPDSGKTTKTYLSPNPYTGPCRMQQHPTQAQQQDSGEDYLLMVRLELQLPMSVTGIRVGDEVTVTASRDPDLLGRVFLVRDLFHKTDASARRIGVTERTD